MITILAIIVVWVVCGVPAYLGTFAHYQKEYARISHEHVMGDAVLAIFMGLLGPFGLVISFVMCDFFRHGFSARKNDPN